MFKPRLLYIIADSSCTGAPRQVLALAKNLASVYEVYCICPAGWLADQIIGTPVKFEVLPAISRRKSIQALSQLYGQIKPDMIHCHGMRGGVYGRLAAPKNTRVLYTEHTWTSDFHLKNPLREYLHIRILKHLSKKTHCTIAVSETVKNFLLNKKIVQKSKVQVIYGGIMPLKPVAKLRPEPVIGSLGSLLPVKGFETLFQSVFRLCVLYPGIRCKIAGTGPEKQKLQSMIQKFNLQKYIEFVGVQEDTESFYKSLQIYIQPSRSEAFGLAALEAMSAGIPVIAGNVGGLAEIIQDQQNGLLFKKENVQDLTTKIQYILENPARAEQLRKEGIRRADSFSIEKMVEKHEKLYHSLL